MADVEAKPRDMKSVLMDKPFGLNAQEAELCVRAGVKSVDDVSLLQWEHLTHVEPELTPLDADKVVGKLRAGERVRRSMPQGLASLPAQSRLGSDRLCVLNP